MRLTLSSSLTALCGVALCLFATFPAYADCTPSNDLVGPQTRASWIEGGLVYDLTNDVLKTCDGTNWTTVGSGGGGTAAGTVAGAVQFRGATAVFAADDSKLVWDNTNKRLGIGTATPGEIMTIVSDNTGSSSQPVVATYSSAAISNGIVGRAARGTAASPTATQAIDRAMAIWAASYGGSTWVNHAAMNFFTAEVQSESARGSYITLDTTANGTTARAERMRIDQNGNVGIGTTSPATKLHVVGGNIANSGMAAPGLIVAPTTGSSYIFGANTALAGAGLYDSTAGMWRIVAKDISGFVGIGTVDPGQPLHLATSQTSVAFPLKLDNYNSTALNGVGVLFSVNGDGAGIYQKERGKGALIYSNPTGAGWNKGDFHFLQNSVGDATNPTLADSVMTITNSGKVGIGITAPQRDLQIGSFSANHEMIIGSGVAGYGAITFGDGTAGTETYRGFIKYDHADDSLGLATSATERLRITGAGNVGIGTASPSVKLDVAGSIRSNAPTGSAMLYLNSVAGQESGILFQEGGVHKWELYKAASNVFSLWYGPTNRTAWVVATNGDMTIYGSIVTCVIGSGMGATNCTSDRRLKKDITPITGALDKLLKINGVSFHWKDPAKAGPEHIGVIAQEVEAVYPQAVVEIDDPTLGKAKAVDIAVLVSPIIEAIRELKRMADDLAAKVENVIVRVSNLEERTMPLVKAVQVLKAENENLEAQLAAANDNDAKQTTAIEVLRRELEALKVENDALDQDVDALRQRAYEAH